MNMAKIKALTEVPVEHTYATESKGSIILNSTTKTATLTMENDAKIVAIICSYSSTIALAAQYGDSVFTKYTVMGTTDTDPLSKATLSDVSITWNNDGSVKLTRSSGSHTLSSVKCYGMI